MRPEDVLAALRQIAGLTPAAPPAVTRVAQGVLGDDGLVGPGQPPATATPLVHRAASQARRVLAQYLLGPGSGPHDEALGAPHHGANGRDTWTCHEGAGAPHGLRPVPDGTLVRFSARRPGRSAAARPAGQSSRPRAELRQVTNLGAVAAVVAGSVQGCGNDMFPRGAQDPSWVRAPGSLTGDCPDARERAERQRIQ